MNKSLFHRKIANSFCLKDIAIFHKKNAYSPHIKISQSFKKIEFAIFHTVRLLALATFKREIEKVKIKGSAPTAFISFFSGAQLARKD